MGEMCVYQVADRFEFVILVGGFVVMRQDFLPGATGFVPMSEEDATRCALEAMASMCEA